MEKETSTEHEAETGYYGQADSFKEVLFTHLRRITDLASKEMRGGYYTIFITKSGAEKEAYVSDAREMYSGAILCLAHIAFSKFDKAMKDKFNEFNEELKELENNFIKSSSVDEEVILGEAFYEVKKDKVLLEQYRTMKLRLHQTLFLDLCKLFGRRNWLTISGKEYD